MLEVVPENVEEHYFGSRLIPVTRTVEEHCSELRQSLNSVNQLAESSAVNCYCREVSCRSLDED